MRAAQHATIRTATTRKILRVTSIILLDVLLAALFVVIVWSSGHYLKSLFDMANLNLHHLIRLSPMTPSVLALTSWTIVLARPTLSGGSSSLSVHSLLSEWP